MRLRMFLEVGCSFWTINNCPIGNGILMRDFFILGDKESLHSFVVVQRKNGIRPSVCQCAASAVPVCCH